MRFPLAVPECLESALPARLPCVPAKVRWLNRQRALSLGGGNASSCQKADSGKASAGSELDQPNRRSYLSALPHRGSLRLSGLLLAAALVSKRAQPVQLRRVNAAVARPPRSAFFHAKEAVTVVRGPAAVSKNAERLPQDGAACRAGRINVYPEPSRCACGLRPISVRNA
jgi:hypothetical protein